MTERDTTLEIDTMTAQDLALVLDWAADEGWNPGLDDLEAFLAADPGGFLMGRIAGEPVAGISAVRHGRHYGFMGLYICRPEHRGQGHAWALAQAGAARLGQRLIGIDGVVEQETNYAKAGFTKAHRTSRYGGSIAGSRRDGFRPATSTDLPALLALDRQMSGVDRPDYAGAWFATTANRFTMVDVAGGAAGTIRACRSGHKIGPLYAPDADAAIALVETLAATSGAHEVYIDVPDTNQNGGEMVAHFGLSTAFSCARMYRGAPPVRPLERVFGEMTFELG